jgi:hypothetical protein
LQNLCSIGFTADFRLVKKQKSPGMPGLIVAKLSAEKGLSAAQGPKQIGTLHSAMGFIGN